MLRTSGEEVNVSGVFERERPGFGWCPCMRHEGGHLDPGVLDRRLCVTVELMLFGGYRHELNSLFNAITADVSFRKFGRLVTSELLHLPASENVGLE